MGSEPSASWHWGDKPSVERDPDGKVMSSLVSGSATGPSFSSRWALSNCGLGVWWPLFLSTLWQHGSVPTRRRSGPRLPLMGVQRRQQEGGRALVLRGLCHPTWSWTRVSDKETAARAQVHCVHTCAPGAGGEVGAVESEHICPFTCFLLFPVMLTPARWQVA